MAYTSPLFLFLATAITALAVENPVFFGALGLERETMFMKSPGAGILLGVIFTWMTTASSLFVAVINHFLVGMAYAGVVRPLLYLVGVSVVYVGTVQGLRKLKLKAVVRHRGGLEEMLPIATFNTALFGAFYISVSQNFGLFQTIGYALGTGLGYTVAILMIYFARRRLALSPIPRSFQGLPILLVYMGLISLALYGLIGLALPT